MTFKRLKTTTEGLLTGDNVVPVDNEVVLSLLDMAFNEVATHADALHLMTMNRDNEVVRLAAGDYIMRSPALPVDDDSELDIDHELCFVTARIIASYVSAAKGPYHLGEAKRLIRDYNSKIYEILESVREQEDGTYDVK